MLWERKRGRPAAALTVIERRLWWLKKELSHKKLPMEKINKRNEWRLWGRKKHIYLWEEKEGNTPATTHSRVLVLQRDLFSGRMHSSDSAYRGAMLRKGWGRRRGCSRRIYAEAVYTWSWRRRMCVREGASWDLIHGTPRAQICYTLDAAYTFESLCVCVYFCAAVRGVRVVLHSYARAHYRCGKSSEAFHPSELL